jgi:hypothetical protein
MVGTHRRGRPAACLTAHPGNDSPPPEAGLPGPASSRARAIGHGRRRLNHPQSRSSKGRSLPFSTRERRSLNRSSSQKRKISDTTTSPPVDNSHAPSNERRCAPAQTRERRPGKYLTGTAREGATFRCRAPLPVGTSTTAQATGPHHLRASHDDRRRSTGSRRPRTPPLGTEHRRSTTAAVNGRRSVEAARVSA